VLSVRVADYDPQWLDQLFLSGEVVWGRLSRPRRDEDQKPSTAGLSRVVPLSLMLRENVQSLLPGEPDVRPPLRSAAQQVVEALASRGALFLGELRTLTDLLPSQLEEALRELAAAGLVTSDSFAAVRNIVEKARARLRRGARSMQGTTSPVGRWSLFPGPIPSVARERSIEAWCRQLLRRYGVVFRDLLTRETAAPAWQELVGTLRHMELRGEIRGGRFVSQVSGEQFAAGETVDLLREVRQQARDGQEDPWIVLSAADPVNLFGVITADQRIPATHRNALIVRGGQVIAVRQAGLVEFRETLSAATAWEMRRAMATGRQPVESENQVR
jgi:ATP-dependent Lhr-like helicase